MFAFKKYDSYHSCEFKRCGGSILIAFQTQLGAALFDNIASMIYSLQSNRRLYETFKKNLKLINVPELLDKTRPADKEVKDTTG